VLTLWKCLYMLVVCAVFSRRAPQPATAPARAKVSAKKPSAQSKRKRLPAEGSDADSNSDCDEVQFVAYGNPGTKRDPSYLGRP
jgi:hypothetical protein